MDYFQTHVLAHTYPSIPLLMWHPNHPLRSVYLCDRRIWNVSGGEIEKEGAKQKD